MNINDFDKLNIGDKLSNKAPFTDSNGKTTIQGYDYDIIYKDNNEIIVRETKMGGEYNIKKEYIHQCLNLHKI